MGIERRTTSVRRIGPYDRRLKPGAVYVVDEKRFIAICQEAVFARFRGVQIGHGKVEGIVLFDDTRHQTPLGLPTLALSVSKFSLATVNAKLAESLEKWRVK